LENEHDIQELIKRIKYPVIVKPCDGSGSKGISKVSEREELVEAFNYALDSSISRKVIVEDFIDGKEYGVESFIYNGDIHVLSVMGKHKTPAPNYAELGHTIPSGLPIDFENKIKCVVANAIDALGISFGAVNMDILVTSSGKVCIIDIGARMGGNLIGSHIIPFGTGFDYMGALIESAVNDLSSFKPENSPTMIATRLLALKPGKIKILPDFNRIGENYGVTILHHMRAGDVIRPYRTNLDGLGYVYALGDSLEDVEERAEKAKIEIDMTTVREV
jgi:biotin carboxylase